MRNWCILSRVIRAADSKFMFCACRKTVPWIHDPEQSRLWKYNLSDFILRSMRFVCHLFYENQYFAVMKSQKWCLPLNVKQTSLIHKNQKCVKCCHIRGMDDNIFGIKQHKCLFFQFIFFSYRRELFVPCAVWTICVGYLKYKQSVFCVHRGWGARGLTLSRITLCGGIVGQPQENLK